MATVNITKCSPPLPHKDFPLCSSVNLIQSRYWWDWNTSPLHRILRCSHLRGLQCIMYACVSNHYRYKNVFREVGVLTMLISALKAFTSDLRQQSQDKGTPYRYILPDIAGATLMVINWVCLSNGTTLYDNRMCMHVHVCTHINTHTHTHTQTHTQAQLSVVVCRPPPFLLRISKELMKSTCSC